jgi:hypothetical protein
MFGLLTCQMYALLHVPSICRVPRDLLWPNHESGHVVWSAEKVFFSEQGRRAISRLLWEPRAQVVAWSNQSYAVEMDDPLMDVFHPGSHHRQCLQVGSATLNLLYSDLIEATHMEACVLGHLPSPIPLFEPHGGLP